MMGRCSKCDGELVSGCDGEGRIVGGLGAVFSWAPKAYRACPEFEAKGGQYTTRSGNAAKYGEVGVEPSQASRAFLFEELGASVTLRQAPSRYVASSDGTGFVSWGGAFALAELLQRGGVATVPDADDLKGARVLELGSGLGLVSIVAVSRRDALR